MQKDFIFLNGKDNMDEYVFQHSVDNFQGPNMKKLRTLAKQVAADELLSPQSAAGTAKIEKLKQKNEKLKKEIEVLRDLNMKLQEQLLRCLSSEGMVPIISLPSMFPEIEVC